MAVTCTETIAPAQAISFGEATGEGVQREANSEDSAPAAQERMPPSMSLALVHLDLARPFWLLSTSNLCHFVM